ncbi:MAG: putative metal-binding motif-containing protein [Myxococcales bacterium]|nr:putative metal-binding motif-containing protein [Myxococcales bacterium]
MRRLLVPTLFSVAGLVGCSMPEGTDAGRTDARSDVRDATADVRVNDVQEPLDVPTSDVVSDTPTQDTGVDTGAPDSAQGCVDRDRDNYGTGAGCMGPDCNDDNPAVNGGATELCDGIDNDCDTMVDEDLGRSSCGMGACMRSVDNCVMGRPQRCEPGMVMPETCNGMDDDCDGTIDNGVGATACYTGPMGTQDVGRCRAGARGCPGGMPSACMGEVLPGAETCNGIDDNCDGTTDEGLSVACYSGPAGTRDIGRCRGGMRNCAGGSMTGCLGEVTPSTESCNNADDDCNGTVDDGIAPIPCYSGPSGTQNVGRCRGGNRVCSMGSMTACTGEIVPVPEVCGNGVDEDCNGMVDDGCGVCTPGQTRTCYTGPVGSAGVGICRSGTETCTAARVWSGTCVGEVLPAAAETCANMLDDNCNSATDEGCMVCSPTVTNDTCGAPAAYTVGSTVSGNTNCAAADYTSSCGFTGGGNDVAYSVALDGTLRTYTFTMVGTGFDTVLHMHSANACSTADEVACNDDDMGMTNRSSFTTGIMPSGSYWLVADGYGMAPSSNRGPFTLTSSQSAEINNDACTSTAAAPAVITRNGTYRGSTAGRVNNYSTTCGSGTNTAPDVVFQISVPAGRTVTVTTCGSTFDTVLYAATTCGGATHIACNDDSCGVQSSITLPATMAATSYFVVLDGYNGASGSYTLNVSGL